jgi:hypothetical protein
MKKIIIGFILGYCLIYSSCKKDFLEKKPNKALLVPNTLDDMALLMDNIAIMNRFPTLQEMASDDFYTTPSGYIGLSVLEKNSYVWATDIYGGGVGSDWNNCYQQMFYANVVLDGVKELDLTRNPALETLKGNAYFFRGLALYNLCQLFAVPFQPNKAQGDLGLPIRLSSDVNEKSVRASLQQTYDQVLNDLILAEKLVPIQVTIKSRPNKASVNGLLARVFLTMGDYSKAEFYADACLKLNDKLIDYNSITVGTGLSFPTALPNNNNEILFHASLVNYTFFVSAQTVVAPDLYSSYAANDLRKKLFFIDRNGLMTFRGTYSGPSVPSSLFSGIATDEIFLIRAECRARNGNVQGAMADLNTLMLNRFVNGTFVPFQLTNANDALVQILKERRKELVCRGLRWTDLRRLNLDPKFAITITRDISGQIYSLEPNSKRYVFPIPDNEIIASGIQQNER